MYLPDHLYDPESPGTEFSQVLSGEWIHITESTTCIGQGRGDQQKAMNLLLDGKFNNDGKI